MFVGDLLGVGGGSSRDETAEGVPGGELDPRSCGVPFDADDPGPIGLLPSGQVHRDGIQLRHLGAGSLDPAAPGRSDRAGEAAEGGGHGNRRGIGAGKAAAAAQSPCSSGIRAAMAVRL